MSGGVKTASRRSLRRVNEWDGPAMLKIYAPYVGTPAAPERELPSLSEYIRRIDRYTYSLGWLLCELDGVPAGFCHLTEDRRDPKDLFSAELQLYVKGEFQSRGVGKALWALMRDILELGNRRSVRALTAPSNPAGAGFFRAMGFSEDGRADGLLAFRYDLTPADPNAERPTKPYLIENLDYERARERAALLIRE